MDDGADLRDSLESGTNMVIQVSYDGHDDVRDGDECPLYYHGDPAVDVCDKGIIPHVLLKLCFRFTKTVKTKRKQREKKREGSGRSLTERGERGRGKRRRRKTARERKEKRRGKG